MATVSAAEAACAAILSHLAQGSPWDACDDFRAARELAANHPRLFHLGALAHARAGSRRVAQEILMEAEAAARDDVPLRVEVLSLRGRLFKDELYRAADESSYRRSADMALKEYAAAFALNRDPFPGINAATLSLLLGRTDEARALAAAIAADVATRGPRTPWDVAAQGEAALLLGDLASAGDHYDSASTLMRDDAGALAAMRRQVLLIARAMPEANAVLERIATTTVFAFTGHMVDSAARTTPRFPSSLVPAVARELRRFLEGHAKPIVFASAACGSDILFIEAALECKADVTIVLPCDRQDFVEYSVAVGGPDWLPRFDAVLQAATRVLYATDEGYLGDDVLFEHAATLIEGLAVLRAAQVQTTPVLLCVLDATSQRLVGGTLTSVERWSRQIGSPHVIDLGALRRQEPPAPPQQQERLRDESREALGPQQQSALASRPRRSLKSLLFADFAGFGRLHDAFAPLFHARFLEAVSAEIEASDTKPLEANTWGDALYTVHGSTEEAAGFAVRLLERMFTIDWTVAGLDGTSQIRIALHHGPVFCGFDPIMARDNYFGSGVTRAARIEPITPPGNIYTSEAFAASLSATGNLDYDLEYMGRLPLAKGYGESRVYRLEERPNSGRRRTLCQAAAKR